MRNVGPFPTLARSAFRQSVIGGNVSRSGNVWDNAAMESFLSSLETERVRRKVYRTRDEARAKGL